MVIGDQDNLGDWYSYATLLIGDSGYVGEEEEEEWIKSI